MKAQEAQVSHWAMAGRQALCGSVAGVRLEKGRWDAVTCQDCQRILAEPPCSICGGAPPWPGAHDGKCPMRAKERRIAFLERKRETTKADLLAKFEDADWHGVADAAMDLRDIESELKGLRA